MVTVARANVEADEFALASTLNTLSSLELETESIVRSGENVVMPLVWVRGVTAAEFEAACAEDATVDDVTLVGDFNDELLYRMEWIHNIDLLLQMLTNTNSSILDAFGFDREWRFRLMCPSREHLSEIQIFCEEHNMSVDIEAIREMDGEPAGRYALTTGQYEALVTAAEKGYFKIPRDVNLEELANELGISHQALSERLRRGTEALVEDTLQTGLPQQHSRTPTSD